MLPYIKQRHLSDYLFYLISGHSFTKTVNWRQGTGWGEGRVSPLVTCWFLLNLLEYHKVSLNQLISSLVEQTDEFKPTQSRGERQKVHDCIWLARSASFSYNNIAQYHYFTACWAPSVAHYPKSGCNSEDFHFSTTAEEIHKTHYSCFLTLKEHSLPILINSDAHHLGGQNLRTH